MAQRQRPQKIIEKGSYSKAAAVQRNQEHKWQQGKGTKKVRKDLMYASEDIILLPPALSARYLHPPQRSPSPPSLPALATKQNDLEVDGAQWVVDG